jgi:hypothetical protein
VCYEQTSLFNGFYFVAPSSFCLRLVPPTKARTHVSQPADNDRHAIHRLDTLSTPGRHPFFPPATPLKIRQPMIGRGKFNASPRRKNTQHPRTPHPGPAVERWKRLPGLSGRNNPVHERRTPTNHPERRLALVDRRLGTVRYGAGLASRIPEASERHRRVKSSKKRKTPFRTICGAGHASVRPSLPRADTWPTVPRVTTTGFRRRRHPRVGPRRVVSWLCCPHRR